MVRFGLASEHVFHEAEADFVEVAFARTVDEARSHCEVLLNNAIPAYIEAGTGKPAPCGIAVLIPSDRLVDASEFLTIQAQIEDDDEDVDDFDDDDDDEDDDDDLDNDDDLDMDDDDDFDGDDDPTEDEDDL